MILSSIVKHVRNQVWTAIVIELLVVVVGVFLGIELGNWNEERKILGLEQSYLDRIAVEIRTNTDRFNEYIRTEKLARDATERFSNYIGDPTSPDSDLVDSTKEFFSLGWTFPKFEPIVTTFEELESTGALQVIRNESVRETIVNLYAEYDQIEEILIGNMPWQISIDARITYEYDALRWDDRTAHLFVGQSSDEEAEDIRSNSPSLTRVAAVHYWLQDRMLRQYEDAITLSNSAIGKIESELAEP